MLSKQVKQRIARNKLRRRTPKWHAEKYWHFRLELGVLQQQRLSSKHLDNASERIEAIDKQIKLLLDQSAYMTRKQWIELRDELRRKTREQLHKDFEGDTLNNLPPMELRNPVVRVPKMRDPIGEYIHTYGHPPIAISPEMQAEIDQALAEREKAMEELKKKGE